ncbi:hypothetical protein [Amycolatopsis sp. ATCC 39116]|nr:hypothetical protein [Amycolatopsis sp. ATCC 39116]
MDLLDGEPSQLDQNGIVDPPAERASRRPENLPGPQLRRRRTVAAEAVR